MRAILGRRASRSNSAASGERICVAGRLFRIAGIRRTDVAVACGELGVRGRLWWSPRRAKGRRRSRGPHRVLGSRSTNRHAARSESRGPLIAAEADLFVVAAFGLIFRQRTLDIPTTGGSQRSSVVAAQVPGGQPDRGRDRSGRHETGVALMVMDAGIDTGAVISIEHEDVMSDDTSESLGARLADLGAAQAVRDIPRWIAGELRGPAVEPERESDANVEESRRLDRLDAIGRRDRAAHSRHVAVAACLDDGQRHFGAGSQCEDFGSEYALSNARISYTCAKRLIVACGEGALELLTLEPAGRRAMAANAYLNGLRAPIWTLGDAGAPPPRRR